jgi:hypothetical protein
MSLNNSIIIHLEKGSDRIAFYYSVALNQSRFARLVSNI